MCDDVKLVLKWIVAIVVTALIVLPLLYLSPAIMPPKDPFGMWRSVMIKLIIGPIAALIMVGAAQYINWITKGDWFAKIEEGNIACAGVTGCLFLAIAYTFGFV